MHRADVLSKHLNETQRRLKSNSKHRTTRATKKRGGLVTLASTNQSGAVEPLTLLPLQKSPLPSLRSIPPSIYDAVVVTRLDLIDLVILRSSLDELLQGTYTTRRKGGRKGEKKKY